MDAEKIRGDFPIFEENPELAYLDSAATSQKPEQVIDAVEKFYREENSNIGRGIYSLANRATQRYEDSRKKVAEFIGAEKDEIVFVRNTTEAENLLAASLEFDGDIVLSKMAHHSEQLPWRRKAEEEDREVNYMESKNGKLSLESAREIIDEKTGLVAFSHISNVFGAVNPVEEIIEIAHENDALVVLDAAQSAPHMKLDVKDLKADFVCFSGHKMLAPSGSGVLYGSYRLLNEMKPYQVGGGMISSVGLEDVEYSEPPEKFEAGTPDVAGAVGLAAAIEYLESLEMREIRNHISKIAGQIREVVEEVEGFEAVSPQEANLVSFRSEDAHPHDVAEVLNDHGVAVRAGHHCAQPQMEEIDANGTVRASPYIYSTGKDVEKLRNGLEKVQDIFG